MPLDLIFRDVLLAWRNAARRPAFTLLVVLTLALGIGVNSAVFALLDAVLLRPLLYRDPARLVFVWQTLPSQNVFELEPTAWDYDAWHEIHGFSEIGLVANGAFTLTGGENPERVRGARVTASLMPMLGISPRIGRGFRPMSDTERANAISHNYTILARLADGTTIERAAAELEIAAARIAAAKPSSHKNVGVRLVPIGEQTVRAIRPTLFVVAGGVALLLLVACANASTLLIARAAGRRHELAVRAALGATTSRLLSLAATECLVLAILGGLVGLMLGNWALGALLPFFASALPPSLTIDIDARAALFTMGVTGVLGLIFGAVVAAQRPDRHLVESLKASTRTTSTASSGRTRSMLVVAQVALAVVLLSASGLMLNSVVKLSRVNTGFAADRLLTFRIGLTGSNYAAPAARVAFASDLLQRLAATPGVRRADLTSTIPFGGSRGANGVEIEGRPQKPGDVLIVDQRHVSGGYFQTMNIPFLRGRGFTASDDSRAERVTVINRAMADRYWPNENPIDRRVRLTAGYDSGTWFRIVGVVENVRHISLSREAVAEMYHPFAQTAVGTFTAVVKTDGAPEAMAPLARSALQAADPKLPMYDVRTMEERIAASFAQTRGTMLLLLVTAMLAAGLSAVAIYGSMWYSVSQRLPELGIRLALGATRASVFFDVLRRAFWLTGIGSAVGLAAAIATSRMLGGLLFETRTTDPITYAVVITAAMSLAILAGVVPARRATRVDPMIALREL